MFIHLIYSGGGAFFILTPSIGNKSLRQMFTGFQKPPYFP